MEEDVISRKGRKLEPHLNIMFIPFAVSGHGAFRVDIAMHAPRHLERALASPLCSIPTGSSALLLYQFWAGEGSTVSHWSALAPS